MDWTMLLHVLLGMLLVTLAIGIVGLLYLLSERRAEVAQLKSCLAIAQEEAATRQRGQGELHQSLLAERQLKENMIAELDAADKNWRGAREREAELHKGELILIRERDLRTKERDEARAALASAHERLRIQNVAFARVGRILRSIVGEVDAGLRVVGENAQPEPEPEPVAKDGSQEIPF